jgi:peptidoglycan/LPS O-acetylase OafA/YrhL
MTGEIRSLTGIRGVAATWVVLYHVHETDDLHGVVKTLLTHGYLAVDLFFLLSGFVMAFSYGRLATAGWNLESYKTFLWLRFGRVYPLYFLVTCAVALMIVVGWSKALPVQNLGAAFLANVALVQVWFSIRSIGGPAWSISTEFTAYLLFPLLAACTLTTRRTAMLLAVPFVCVVAIYFLQFVPTPPNNAYRMGPLDVFWGGEAVLRCLSEFTIGLVTYRLTQFGRVKRWAGKPLVAYAVTAVLLTLLCTPDMDVLAVIAMSSLLLVLALGDDRLSRLMGSRIVFFFGEISYSMYLLHTQFLRLRRIGETRWLVSNVGAVGADVVALTVLYASLVLCSWLTYRMVERPCREWLRQVGNSREKLARLTVPPISGAVTLPLPLTPAPHMWTRPGQLHKPRRG